MSNMNCKQQKSRRRKIEFTKKRKLSVSVNPNTDQKPKLQKKKWPKKTKVTAPQLPSITKTFLNPPTTCTPVAVNDQPMIPLQHHQEWDRYFNFKLKEKDQEIEALKKQLYEAQGTSNTLRNERDRVSGRVDILTDRIALYESLQKDLHPITTPPVVHPTCSQPVEMPEVEISSQQCDSKHAPKQQIAKPHVVKLSGVRGKKKPDVYARNEKAEPAPQVKTLTLRQNPRQQPPSKQATTPKQKIIPRESTQVGSRRLSPAEKASIMPDGNNLPFKLPKYDVNPKKSKAMLSETEPPCIDNGASAMEVDSPVTEKEITPSKSTITITPIEKPIVEQQVQKQSMDAQAAVRPANEQSIELSEVEIAPIV